MLMRCNFHYIQLINVDTVTLQKPCISNLLHGNGLFSLLASWQFSGGGIAKGRTFVMLNGYLAIVRGLYSHDKAVNCHNGCDQSGDGDRPINGPALRHIHERIILGKHSLGAVAILGGHGHGYLALAYDLQQNLIVFVPFKGDDILRINVGGFTGEYGIVNDQRFIVILNKQVFQPKGEFPVGGNMLEHRREGFALVSNLSGLISKGVGYYLRQGVDHSEGNLSGATGFAIIEEFAHRLGRAFFVAQLIGINKRICLAGYHDCRFFIEQYRSIVCINNGHLTAIKVNGTGGISLAILIRQRHSEGYFAVLLSDTVIINTSGVHIARII